ncbi:apolipoprotein N-acyltransferase [Anatilimnocola floriformis]|uniref:apolipoprotein N-acyltransferase n=1 Tax=Anatilimnocola floriformis TaxID=2948575 RepID=UPI0020C1BCC7|nr:apolipoprotein N-acyltransferase [Anatilimnocola floriformis]
MAANSRLVKADSRRSNKDAPAKVAARPEPAVPWPQRTWVLMLAGSLLLWASFPPLDLWPLAWLAPLPWLLLIRREQLAGKRPYLHVAVGGFVFWLLMLQGVRLAHPLLYGGWIALAAYLTTYLVLFIAITRVAVHRLRWPLFLAAPIVWTGLEFLRANLISGFACGMLAHTQTALPILLQIADLGSAYLVSFVMLLVTAVIAERLPANWLGETNKQHGPVAVVIAVVCVALTLSYGWYRLAEKLPENNRKPLQVALIQGSLDTRFDQHPQERMKETFGQYDPLTRETLAKSPQIDLVVWPESMFAVAEFQTKSANQLTDSSINAEKRQFIKSWQGLFETTLGEVQRFLPESQFLFGTTTLQFDLRDENPQPKNYNVALLAAPGKGLVNRYYKMHPVMFGEFVPLTDLFPALTSLTPIGEGMSVGNEPVLMEVRDYALAPNICFESTVPHLLRQQVSHLEQENKRPIDAIVNISNDGWFKASGILDLHFRCSVFRAIENRKPVIIAANTGISAHIDGNGRVIERGPKRSPKPLVASVVPDGRRSPYHSVGDLFAWLCAGATWGVALFATLKR